MNTNEVLLILGMMAVTFSVRYFPLLTANRVALSKRMENALKFIPVAVLSAIIATATLIPSGDYIDAELTNPHLISAVAAALVAYFSRHLMLTVVIGLLVFAGLKIFAGL